MLITIRIFVAVELANRGIKLRLNNMLIAQRSDDANTQQHKNQWLKAKMTQLHNTDKDNQQRIRCHDITRSGLENNVIRDGKDHQATQHGSAVHIFVDQQKD